MKLIMMKGLPASGKSSWAKAYQQDTPNTKIISNDDLRDMLDSGKWSPKNEKFMLKVRDNLISLALTEGKNVIVDGCHLHQKHATRLSSLAQAHGAHFELQDFSHVPPEECVKRDLQRTRSVGSDVIWRMYYQFVFKPEAVPYNEGLPNTILVDIDGTLAHMGDRGPFDWKRVGEDEVNAGIRYLVNAFWSETDVVLLSGRDSCCRSETIVWLAKHDVRYDALYMRPEGDNRKDVEVKRELYEQHIKGKYNVRFVVDDRPSVIRGLWEPLGFTVLNVGKGYEF